MPKTVLTTAMQLYIKQNYLQQSGKAISRHLNIEASIVQRFLKKNHLTVPKELITKYRIENRIPKHSFTKADEDFVRENYLTMPVKRLGTQLNKTGQSIIRCLDRLGLVIPPEVIEQRKIDSRIKPGNTPINKGKKQSEYMSAEQIAKTTATRFKKGGLPGNTLHDGAITTRVDHKSRNGRPYVYIRLSLGKWEKLQRVNWEKVNGPIPQEHCLWCIDGDTLNCDPSNWELITRKENYLRNSGSTKLEDKYVGTMAAGRNRKDLIPELLNHPELLELKRNEYRLNRAIKQAQQHGK